MRQCATFALFPTSSTIRALCGDPLLTIPSPLFLLPFQGNKRTLQYEDVYDIPDALYTQNVYPGFDARFQKLVSAAEAVGGPKVC